MTLKEYKEKAEELISFLDEMESKLKKISDELDRKPREWWLVKYPHTNIVYPNYETAFHNAEISFEEIIHVKEVIND